MGPVRNTRSSRQVDPMAPTPQATHERRAPPLPTRLPSPDGIPSAPRDPRPAPLALPDLECVRTLGKGVYGKVLLVRVRRLNSPHPLDRPGTVFAMKVIQKRGIRRADRHNPAEKDYERGQLSRLPWSPWVNGIVQTFVDDKNLYLALEFVPCGSLHAAIQQRAPFELAVAAFYYANIVCGLAFLQGHDVVHRDLKPENVLVGADGYLCLADFGAAKREEGGGGGGGGDGGDWPMVGTPAYMAPELINPRGYIGRSIDWWASGCILFEMVAKKMPFYCRNSQQGTFKRVMSGEYRWPSGMRVGNDLRDLVSGLLAFDAENRLGTFGVCQVVEHPWLGNVDWERMEAKQYIAPCVPKTARPMAAWLDKALPAQGEVPGLRVVEPPVELQYDERFPAKKTL